MRPRELFFVFLVKWESDNISVYLEWKMTNRKKKTEKELLRAAGLRSLVKQFNFVSKVAHSRQDRRPELWLQR